MLASSEGRPAPAGIGRSRLGHQRRSIGRPADDGNQIAPRSHRASRGNVIIGFLTVLQLMRWRAEAFQRPCRPSSRNRGGPQIDGNGLCRVASHRSSARANSIDDGKVFCAREHAGRGQPICECTFHRFQPQTHPDQAIGVGTRKRRSSIQNPDIKFRQAIWAKG